jgi:hypothetical protein
MTKQIKASEIKPGMIVDIWGDRILVTETPEPHTDGGRRLIIGGYAVFADQPITLVGHFNP